MPTFSKTSLDRLATCDPRLQEVFQDAIKYVDFTVLCGERSQEDQEKAFAEGNTKVHFPNSRHNSHPSKAVDAIPCPIEWIDLKGMDKDTVHKARYMIGQALFAGLVIGLGASKGYKITWGGDWNRNFIIEAGDDWDRPHFQIED